MLRVGQKIRTFKYGKGYIKKVDSSDEDFTYLCKFFDFGRTLVWLPKNYKFLLVKRED